MEKHMRDVCGSDLWDSRAIYSSNPDFTFCFRYTLLIWAPCFFLWSAAPLWIFKITKKNGPRPNSKRLFIPKIVALLILIFLEIVNLGMAFYDKSPPIMFYLTPLISISTYILVMFIIYIENSNTWPHSTIVFIFWLILFLTSLFTLRSNILFQLSPENERPKIDELKAVKLTNLDLLVYYIKFMMITASLVLSTLREPNYKETSFKKTRRAPEKNSSLLSVLTFWWINQLISTGFKRDLTRDDLWEIDEAEETRTVTEKIESVWNPKAQEYIFKMRDIENERMNHRSDDLEMDDMAKQKLNTNKTQDEIDKAKKKIHHPSFTLCLVQIYIYKYIGILSIKIAHDSLNFLKPLLLDNLITFVKDKQEKMSVGLFFIFGLCLLSLIQTLINTHFHHNLFLAGQRLKNGIMNTLFRKSLKISKMARKSTTIGEMTNLITTNAASFEHHNLMLLMNLLSTPLQIVLSTYFLWRYLGWATLAGLASMLAFIPINVYLTRTTKRLRVKKHALQDERIKLLNEVFIGIRMIKFMGWERSFEKLVNRIREKELRNLVKAALWRALSSLSWSLAPFMVTLVAFGTFILMNEENNLDPNSAFVCLTLFNMLRQPLNSIPRIIQGLIQLNVSITRIRKFLLLDEIQESDVSHEDIPGYAVKVENANFGWTTGEATLKNISFDVEKGKLIGIVGRVASGKSSLLSALLCEMHKLPNGNNEKSQLNVSGSRAYVPQHAWIKNDSVRSNIMFTSNLAREHDAYYDEVVEACALKPDLALMASGDETEIGEKGINLSGGQKQRISLARALYARADLYLLDDPLSSVDSNVGKHIFDRVIGPNGMLKNKTRLFVTNSLGFLPQTDYILMLEDGCLVEKGTYEELIQKDGLFAEFIHNYLKIKEINQKESEIEDESDDDDDDTINLNIKFLNPDAVSKKSKLSKFDRKKDSSKKANKKIITKEKIESGTVKLSVIIEYIKSCRLWISAVFLLLYILSHVCDISASFWLSDWSNDAIEDPKAAINKKYFRLTVYAVLGFSKSLIMMLGDLCFVAMFIKASKIMHIKMLHSMLRGTLHFFDSTPTGRIVNRFTKDIEATEDSIPQSIKILVECLLSMISTIFVISTTTPLFLFGLVPVMAFYVFVQRYYVPSNRQIKRLQSASKSPIFSHFSETQSGLSTVRAYGAQDIFAKQMEKYIDEYYVFQYSNMASSRWLALRLEIVGNLVTIMAALFAIFARDKLSAGLAGLSISLSLSMSHNLNSFVRTTSQFEANITSVERIIEYYSIQHEAPWIIDENRPPDKWPSEGSIRISDLSVSYRPDLPPVLKHLSIGIEPKEKIGIVGRTGAGKSTLALALFRLIEPLQGHIEIDGVNTSLLGVHDLRHKITMIPQDPVIYSGSIRENLDPFGRHTDDELRRVLELAHLDEESFSSSCGAAPPSTAESNFLDFQCAEYGHNLSAGQGQLICLARALLRKTRILVLDEATASIDHNTDELIQRTIRSEFAHCTVLTIAHRLNTIMDSSRILVLENGKIIEFDSPKVLLADKKSAFYSMAKDAGLVV